MIENPIPQLHTRIGNLWEKIRGSFWFIPSLMSLGAFALFFLMQEIDQRYPRLTYAFFNDMQPIGADGARTLLSTIAGSMVTVAGTVFSITIVALALASNQFGPRLLRNFIRNSSNQIVLGSFISCFLYCLCVLTSIQPQEESFYVPRLSVYMAMLLAIFNVGILIYFIHHIATSIQADQVVHEVSAELIQRMDSLQVDFGDKEVTTGRQLSKPPGLTFAKRVSTEHWGYIQVLDYKRLLHLACENNCLLELKKKPGNYVASGEELMTVQAGAEIDEELYDKLRHAFIIGSNRSAEQDVEFSITQLVEVAVRALSPGINDPNTALTCLDHLSTALSLIVREDFPDSEIGDEESQLRLIIMPLTFAGVTNAAFNEIRQHGTGNAAVLIRMVETMTTIAACTDDRNHQQELSRHIKLVERNARRSLPEAADLADLEERMARFEAVLS